MKNKTEPDIDRVYGICAHHIQGGSTIIFNDLLTSLGIRKRFYNSSLKGSKENQAEINFISFQPLSKSPSTWLRFLYKYIQTSYFILKNTQEYNLALANELISILYVFPHRLFRNLGIIYYCHSAFRQTKFNKMFLARFINYCTKKVVVPSLYLKDELIEMGINDSKIQCIYNGIEEFTLPYSSNNSSSSNRLTVCIVGIIQHQKGQDIFIKAINNLNQNGYQITGNIVGPIGEEDYYESLKKQTIMTEQLQTIKFVGTLDHQSLIEFMNTQDVVICLSRYRETLPTVLLEAMLLRKAIVGTNIGGIPEIITDGENGYLIDPDNVNQVQDAILKLMDQEHRMHLGESGYNLFKNKFNRETFLSQHKLLIQKCFQKQIEN